MYKDEALFLLKGGKAGVLEWNRPVAAGKANLDLSGIKLPAAKLMGVKLMGANLEHVIAGLEAVRRPTMSLNALVMGDVKRYRSDCPAPPILTSGPPFADIIRINHPYGASREFDEHC